MVAAPLQEVWARGVREVQHQEVHHTAHGVRVRGARL